MRGRGELGDFFGATRRKRLAGKEKGGGSFRRPCFSAAVSASEAYADRGEGAVEPLADHVPRIDAVVDSIEEEICAITHAYLRIGDFQRKARKAS